MFGGTEMRAVPIGTTITDQRTGKRLTIERDGDVINAGGTLYMTEATLEKVAQRIPLAEKAKP